MRGPRSARGIGRGTAPSPPGRDSCLQVDFFCSHRKSVTAVKSLWMLELASQRGFWERIQAGACAPFIPWNVETSGLPRSSEKGMADCPVAGPRTGSLIGPHCCRVRGSRAYRRVVGPGTRRVPPSCRVLGIAENPQPIDGKSLIRNYTLGTGARFSGPRPLPPAASGSRHPHCLDPKIPRTSS